MGLFNRRPQASEVAAIVAETVKALVPGLGNMPASASTTDLTARAVEVANAGMQSSQFGPGAPLIPRYIDPREPGQSQPAPRRSEYPVSVNLQLQNSKLVPFSVLRDTADRVDVVRTCIEVRKSHLISLDWDIRLSRKALKQIMTDEGIDSPGEASQLARRRLQSEMARLRAWWERPDKVNGLDFDSWLSMLLEDLFVIDAVTIWPQRTLGGDLVAFDLIDGATIKPLLDSRGATPMPPAPAYQQILYGFPRGEWVASVDPSQELQVGQLVYRPRHRRTWSPYGMSETERVLSAADLYLKRIGWIRSEFDDGTVPDQWMKTDVGVGGNGMNPDQLLQFESVMNQSLAGQTAERHALHLLPKGFEPVEMVTFAEKYNPALDDFLIKLVCMNFSVMPSEAGFPPAGGLGGKGHQEGEANSAYRKDILPTVSWLQSLFTELSRDYLGMPDELEFAFLDYEVEDQIEAETAADMRVKGGRSTLNDELARMGKPLYNFPEADVPFIQTAAGIVFLPGALSGTAAMDAPGKPSAPGVADPNAIVEEGSTSKPPTGPPSNDTAVTPGVAVEAAKFVAYTRKRAGKAWRPFVFDAVDATAGAELNKAGAAGDIDTVRRLAAALTEE